MSSRPGECRLTEAAAVLLVQLDPQAPPGLIAEVARQSGVSLSVRQAAAGLSSSDMASATGLIVLGSGAARVELESAATSAVRECLRTGRPVLGLDAGAQILALAAGGAVRAGASHEFGYVDLSPSPEGLSDPVLAALRSGLPVMEWHDDAIDPPEEAVILARCIRGRPQAFRLGRASYGLRFHPGATSEIARGWAALRGAASNNPAIRVRIGAEMVRHQERAERFGRHVIESWLRLLA